MIRRFIVTVLLFVSLPFAAFGFNSFGLDTVAGESTVLRGMGFDVNDGAVFSVRRPDGRVVDVESKVLNGGVAFAEFSGENTRLAGKYGVKTGDSLYNYFTVSAGEVSDNFSAVFPAEQVVSLDEVSRVTVSLKDEFGNPVVGHKVRLIPDVSNGSFDYADSEVTNRDGEIVFNVGAFGPGVVNYEVYDLTEGLSLSKKASVVFLGERRVFRESLSNLSWSAMGNSSGPVDTLEFFDIPAVIESGEVLTFGLRALDGLDQKVVSYDGTVRFSVVGNNSQYVSFPNDYSFRMENQGEHRFSLGLLFSLPGEYKLRATDLNNLAAFGEIDVTVVERRSSGSLAGRDGKVVITNPLEGTYSNAVQVISGFATPGAGLKIFDNDLEIAQVVADLDGRFSFTTRALTSGDHSIYVAEVNEIGTIIEVSEPVAFKLVTEALGLGELVFDPEGQVVPGSVVNVKVEVAERLSSLTLVIDDSFYDLDYNSLGYYEGAFVAPMDFGLYEGGFELTDALGNKSVVEEAFSLRVGAFDFEEKVVPPTVANLRATALDRRVVLEWDAVVSNVNEVVHYRVYYGLSPTDLSQAVDTFTTEPTWYVPNLINGQTYYFAVVAVDDRTNISDAFSNIVLATPTQVVEDVVIDIDVIEGSAGQDALDDMERDVSDAGPGVFGLILFSLFGGYFYRKLA